MSLHVIGEMQMPVADVAVHTGKAGDFGRAAHHRATEEARVVLDHNILAAHDGVAFEDRMVQHPGSVEHHAVGTHICRRRDHATIGHPTATVRVTRTRRIVQQIRGADVLEQGTDRETIGLLMGGAQLEATS